MSKEKLLFSATVYDFIVLPAPHNKRIRTKRVQKYYECRDGLAEELQKCWEMWNRTGKGNGKQIKRSCRMKAIVCRKSRRQADFDNLGKTVGDALVKAEILKDDSLIYSGEIIKRVGWPRDYVVVSIYSYNHKKKP